MYQPKLAQSAAQSIKSASRRIIVSGAGGVGKTTFSISASKYAGNSIPAPKRVQCSDVAVIQGDNEGIVGAVRAGFVPGYVYDFTDVRDWGTYKTKLLAALKDLKPLVDEGALNVIVIDLATPNRLVHRYVNPTKINEWVKVAAEGEEFFHAFDAFKGATVIGNAQLKAASSVAETMQAIDASNAKAAGGERATFTSDLLKGLSAYWMENASLWMTRELKRKKVGPDTVAEYFTHTQSNAKFEAKSRFRDTLKPTEPGNVTLRALLDRGYGDIF